MSRDARRVNLRVVPIGERPVLDVFDSHLLGILEIPALVPGHPVQDPYLKIIEKRLEDE